MKKTFASLTFGSRTFHGGTLSGPSVFNIGVSSNVAFATCPLNSPVSEWHISFENSLGFQGIFERRGTFNRSVTSNLGFTTPVVKLASKHVIIVSSNFGFSNNDIVLATNHSILVTDQLLLQADRVALGRVLITTNAVLNLVGSTTLLGVGLGADPSSMTLTEYTVSCVRALEMEPSTFEFLRAEVSVLVNREVWADCGSFALQDYGTTFTYSGYVSVGVILYYLNI